MQYPSPNGTWKLDALNESVLHFLVELVPRDAVQSDAAWRRVSAVRRQLLHALWHGSVPTWRLTPLAGCQSHKTTSPAHIHTAWRGCAAVARVGAAGAGTVCTEPESEPEPPETFCSEPQAEQK